MTMRPRIKDVMLFGQAIVGRFRVLAAQLRLAEAAALMPTRRVAKPAPIIVPKSSQIDLDGQWKRVTGQVDSALARSKAVASAQATAIEKLDAAEYAFDRLLEELSAAMTVTPRAVTTATLLAMPEAAADGASAGRIAA